MLCHKCKHFGPDFQVVYISRSSKGSSLNLDCWHLKMWTWRRSPHSTAGSRCGWFLSSLLAVHNLSSLFSSSSHLSGCTASLLEPGRPETCPLRLHLTEILWTIQWQRHISVLFAILLLKILHVPRLGVSGIWCRASHLKRSQQGIFLGACIFQSHFCC